MSSDWDNVMRCMRTVARADVDPSFWGKQPIMDMVENTAVSALGEAVVQVCRNYLSLVVHPQRVNAVLGKIEAITLSQKLHFVCRLPPLIAELEKEFAQLPRITNRSLIELSVAQLWFLENGEFYKLINVALASEDPAFTRDAMFLANLMSNGMDSVTPPACGRCGKRKRQEGQWGGDLVLWSGRRRISDRDVAAMSDAHETSQVLTLSSVLATSTDDKIVKRNFLQRRVESGDGSMVLLNINVPAALLAELGGVIKAPMALHEANANEKEVVLFPGVRFRVTGYERLDNVHEFIIDVVRGQGGGHYVHCGGKVCEPGWLIGSIQKQD